MTPRLQRILFALSLSLIWLLFQNCSRPTEGFSTATTDSPEVFPEIIVAFGDSLTRGSDPKNPANTGIKGYATYLQNLMGPNYLIVNCGIGGQTTADSLPRFMEILNGDYTNCSLDIVDSPTTAAFYDFNHLKGQPPKQVLLWLGTNNLLKNSPQQKNSYLDLNAFIQSAVAKNINIVVGTPPPYSEGTAFTAPSANVFGRSVNRVTMFNSMIRNLILENPSIKWVDLYSVLEPNWPSLTWDGIHLNSTANELVAQAWYQGLKNPQQPDEFQNGCTVAAGKKLFSGQITCSCASGVSGTLYQCVNGTFEELGSVGTACIDQAENHAYMTFHCL